VWTQNPKVSVAHQFPFAFASNNWAVICLCKIKLINFLKKIISSQLISNDEKYENLEIK
jgi:hypothetical protein